MRMILVAACGLFACGFNSSGAGGDGNGSGDGDGDGSSRGVDGSGAGTMGSNTSPLTTGPTGTADGPTTAPTTNVTTTNTATDTSTGTSVGLDSSSSGPSLCPGPSTACLSNDGLLVRYFLDEADMGQPNVMAMDSAPTPLNLPIDYTGSMNYTEAVDGNRGLEWTSTSSGAVPAETAEGTKIDMLHGSTTGTIEVVVDVENSDSTSRITNIGEDTEGGLFSMRMSSSGNPELRWQGETQAGAWGIQLEGMGRTVAHLVLNTNEGVGAQRVRLYINGVQQPDPSGSTPAMGQTIDLSPGTFPELALGNRAVGGRSFEGVLYYAAMYTTALSDADIVANAAILIVDDDTPMD